MYFRLMVPCIFNNGFLVQLDNTVYFDVLYALYMFRVFITHRQERHCKLGRRFDNL
jgi:hypothetical protein